MNKTKEELIREMENGIGLGARMAKRELEYVRRLWRGEQIVKKTTKEKV